MDLSKIYRASDPSKPISLPKVQESNPITFPSEWFSANSDKKPPVVIPVFTLDKDKLFRSVDAGLSGGTVRIDAILMTLKLLVPECLKAKAGEKWVSFNRTLAEPDMPITPFDLIEVSERKVDVPADLAEKGQMTVPELGLLAKILVVYRLARVAEHSVTQYKEKVRDRMVAILSQPPFNIPRNDVLFSTRATNNVVWGDNRSFRVIVAAIDMFLVHFPEHEAGALRVTTLTSRLRDCAILPAVEHLGTTLGLQTNRAALWCFGESIQKEMDFISTEGQEIEHGYSYSYYISDMGLCQRSPYSVTANPNLHSWIHMVCALLQQQRSLNARMLEKVAGAQVFLAAAIPAYAHRTRAVLRREYTGTETEADSISKMRAALDASQEPEEGENLDDCPKDLDPGNWFNWSAGMSHEMPAHVLATFKRTTEGWTDVRDGSVARFLKEFLRGYTE